MKKVHVKRGEEVVVLSGAERGKRGKIIAVDVKAGRVIVEGLKMIKRHTKKTREAGSIIEREGTLHISNVMKAEKFDARVTKRGAATPAQA
jgi:large subunit ribosomal protein L24